MGYWEIIIIALMLLLNGIFAGYEMSLASLSLGRIRELAEKGRPGARAALTMKSRMEASLAVVQIGITLVGAMAAAMAGPGPRKPYLPGYSQSWACHPLLRISSRSPQLSSPCRA